MWFVPAYLMKSAKMCKFVLEIDGKDGLFLFRYFDAKVAYLKKQNLPPVCEWMRENI